MVRGEWREEQVILSLMMMCRECDGFRRRENWSLHLDPKKTPCLSRKELDD